MASIAQLQPDFDVYEGTSTGNGFDTGGIVNDMTALIARVPTGSPSCGLSMKIQHADVDALDDYVDHPAPITFNGYSAVVLLQRSQTKRYVRILTVATEPTDDPLFVSGGVITW